MYVCMHIYIYVYIYIYIYTHMCRPPQAQAPWEADRRNVRTLCERHAYVIEGGRHTIPYRRLWKKHSSGETYNWTDKLSERQLRWRIEVLPIACMVKARTKGMFFSQTPVPYWRLWTKTFVLLKPLPCSPAAEIALPTYFGAQKAPLPSFLLRRSVFSDTGTPNLHYKMHILAGPTLGKSYSNYRYYLSRKGCPAHPTLGTNLVQTIIVIRIGCMAALGISFFDRLVKKDTPWQFWGDNSRLTGVLKKSLCQQKHGICSDPISADPIRPLPRSGGVSGDLVEEVDAEDHDHLSRRTPNLPTKIIPAKVSTLIVRLSKLRLCLRYLSRTFIYRAYISLYRGSITIVHVAVSTFCYYDGKSGMAQCV